MVGDCEVGARVERAGPRRLNVDIDKMPVESPTVETEEVFTSLFSAKTLEEASRGAGEESHRIYLGLEVHSAERAYMLTSITCDLMISQVVNPLVTVRVRVPKEIL